MHSSPQSSDVFYILHVTVFDLGTNSCSPLQVQVPLLCLVHVSLCQERISRKADRYIESFLTDPSQSERGEVVLMGFAEGVDGCDGISNKG